MKVIVSAQVRDFLRSEKAYLKRYSRAAAKRLTQRMRETSRMLAQFPMIGSERVLPIEGLRRLVVDDYALDYEIRDAEVHILAMRHGRQRDPLLDDDADFDFEVHPESLERE